MYYLYNAHGDVIQLINSSGTVTKTYDYDAYGNELTRDLNDINPFRYCGEYYDTETGFIYLRARYYNPSNGRFISVDPIKDGLNWYAYCSNNPLSYTDPWGLYKKDLSTQATTVCFDGSGGTTTNTPAKTTTNTTNTTTKTPSNAPAKTTAKTSGLSAERGNVSTGKINMVDFGNEDVSGKYKTAEMAVLEFASEYYTTGMYLRLECSATIYKSGQLYYTINDAIYEPHKSFVKSEVPAGTKFVGYVHTHPNGMEFSPKDKDLAEMFNCDAYVVLPSGNVSKYDISVHDSDDIASHEEYIQKELSDLKRLSLMEKYRHVWEEHFGANGCHICDSYKIDRTDWPNLNY